MVASLADKENISTDVVHYYIELVYPHTNEHTGTGLSWFF